MHNFLTMVMLFKGCKNVSYNVLLISFSPKV